jgi:glycosyltransferase involved in cell wall biosynthesis
LGLFRKKFDIVISRTRFFNTSILALIYAKIKKVKWIHIEHGSDFVQLSSLFKTFVAKAYDHIFGRLIFKASDLNISISKAVQIFVTKFDKRESPVIYRGIDFEEIDKINPDLELKEKYKNKIIISFCGRLYKWKGVENSIQAIKLLPREIKEQLVFLIIGGGEDFERLRKISDDTTVFTGSLPREKAISILKISDVYIHSSEPGGGLSTSLLEAMHCGCAVITTPHEGAREIIANNENGLLIENSDSKLIAEKIEDLVKNERLRKNISIEARKNIIEIFSWQKSLEKYFIYLK